MWTPWIVGVLILTALAGMLVVRPALKRKRRRQLMATPLPESWKSIIRNRVPLAHALPGPLQQRLSGLVQVFLDEKRFEGCNGLEITDEIRVTVAAQACLMLTGLSTIHPYPGLATILVYPAAYSARHAEQIGAGFVNSPQFRAGESWSRGAVILSWDHVHKGSANSKDGRNVVFHEFAHQLDQAYGSADGVPDLREWSAYAVWSQVMTAAYKRLVRAVEKRQPHFMDAYGATHPAEFFAVATETFFEKPHQMKREAPDLYGELSACYQLDPSSWTSN